MKRMKGLSIGILAALVANGMAQSTTDHPNLKSNNQRTGANSDIINSGPGYLSVAGRTPGGATVPSALRWFLPLQSSTPVNALRLNEINVFQTVIDNSDQGNPNNVDSGGNPVGPYDPLPNGFAGVVNGSWFDSPLDGEATNAYTVSVRRNVNLGNPGAPIDFTGVNLNPRFPHYGFARTTASAGGQGQDPRIAANPAALSSFRWSFSPRFSRLNGFNLYDVFPETANRSYAIYVWLPVGPTNIGGTNVFPQRYYAYEITYGRGQRYVEIVDTLQAGGGWVRLGNGGRATNQMFPYGGLDGLGNPFPLQVRLLNTIPRDANDQLLEPVNTAQPADRFLVYADAVKFSAEPDAYFATPTSAGFGTADVRVVAARNDRTVDPSSLPPVASTNFRFKPLTVGKGVVTSLDYNFGTQRWRYSPLENGPDTRSFDDTSTSVIPGGLDVAATNHQLARAGGYITTPVVGTVPTNNTRINPDTNLPDGGYELYMYVGGDQTASGPFPALNFAHTAEYTITSEGTTETFIIDLRGIRTDQTVTPGVPLITYRPGWVRLGNRRYTHSQAERLEINFNNSSQDPLDVGRSTYVDEIRFVGSVGTEINSTPVHTRAFVRDTPGSAPVERNLVIVADERGRLHCLDAEGRPDGTTTCYWTYPSLKADSTTDPNLMVGLDTNDPSNQMFDGELGTLQAQMATNFDLSTAVVERMVVDGPGVGSITRDYLIIGSTNGRVYCIAMEGRGDQDVATNTPGTTFRRWTFPETFPSTNPQNSNLGAISSVVSGELVISGVTRKVIYAATEQGRIYALDAEGTFQYSGAQNLNTTVLWQFPPANVQTVNTIVGAPTLDVANNRIFFATTQSDDLNAGIYCLDARTGALTWQVLSTTFLDFLGGSCYVPASELNRRTWIGTGARIDMPDSLFIQNENGNVYAFNANNGSLVWSTNELLSGGSGSITYTEIRALQAANGEPSIEPVPVLMVPTESGRFAALFARLGEETRFGRRQAWGFETEAPIKSTMTVSNKWMFGSTTNGYLFAWSDPIANPTGGFIGNDIFPPGNETITDNNRDPSVEQFRNCRIAFLSAEGFRRLRRTSPGGISGQFNLGDVLDTGTLAGAYMGPNGDLLAPYRNTRTNGAFEWGETIYVIAYNFPVVLETAGDPPIAIPPPILEATVTTEGRATRPIAAEARLFLDRTPGDPNGGYAVFAIPLTAGGGTAQTPGPGRIQMQLRTSAANRNNIQQTITLNPAQTNLAYQVANPIGISVEDVFGSNPQWQLGYTLDSGRPDALVNGSPNLTGVPGVGNINGQLFGRSVGTAAHGASKKTLVNVFDRSLITLLRGEGRGLDLTRVDRRDLRWQGGAGTVVKPFANIPGLGALMGAFEDLPSNFPNNSLDYPDLAREQVRVRKDPNGNVENPVFNSVSLTGPLAAGGGVVDEFNASSRVIRPTVFEFQVDVPRYQPVNLGQNSIPNQAGAFWQAGYAGRFTVYIDSDGTGQFTTGNGNRKAYRTFNLASAVSPDERIVIGNPNVDLGSLSGGVGYDSALTYSNTFPYRNLSPATAFNPYGGFQPLFKPLQIFNDGNVNLWNVRLAKGAFDTVNSLFFPWQILSQGNRDEVWLDGTTDLHSDLDSRFAIFGPSATNNVIVQKPRVGDVNGRQLRLNPTSRLNPNLPQSGQLLIPGRADINRDARVAVSIPFGMPVGRYSQLMRVIEDTGANRNLTGASVADEAIALGYTTTGTAVPFESFSDPTFTLSFTVRETRLTGGNSDFTNPVVNGAQPVNAAQPAQWTDVQPAGIREVNGDLTFAFASNRPDFYPLTGNPNPTNRNTRIFVGRINGANMGANVAGRGLQSTLRDLNQFVPAAAGGAMRWWEGQAILPNVPDATMFSNTLTNGLPSPIVFGGTIVPGTATYGNPVFSTTGSRDMTGAAALPYKLIAYTGSVKRQTPTGVINDSRIFVTRFNNDGSIGNTRSLDVDPTSLKDKPTIIQNGEFATIFFSSESNGARTIYLTEYNDSSGFTNFQSLGFGSGFEGVSSPSSIMRMTRLGVPEINTLFTARLRGSSVQELFMSRMRLQNGAWTFIPWADTVVGTGQLVENLVFDNRVGGYRPRGSQWQGFFNITLGNGTPVAAGPAVVDRQTQIARIPTIFGGDMVIDTNLGVVKFTQANLPQNTQLILTYAPLYLRVSNSAVAGYSAPSMVFDLRLEPSNTNTTYAFWKTPSGADQPAASTSTFSHRFMVSAIRSAATGGQVGRPVMSTFRYGVRLGRALRVNPDGSLAEPLTITGNTGAYQLDPAAGRVYFTMDDEDQVVRINLNGNVFERRVSLVGESAEDFVPMDRPMNESNFNLFLDSQSFPATRRGLVWGIWSSTREGAPSLFMQGMARKITPFLPSQ
jgi:hypothetical protein